MVPLPRVGRESAFETIDGNAIFLHTNRNVRITQVTVQYRYFYREEVSFALRKKEEAKKNRYSQAQEKTEKEPPQEEVADNV